MAITISPSVTTPGQARAGTALVVSGRQRRWGMWKIALDTSYPTGGYDLTGLFSRFKSVDWGQAQDASGARLVSVDVPNKKLMVFTALGTEAANASNQSTITTVYVELGGY